VFLPRDNARDIQRDILTLVTRQLPGHFHIRPDQIQVLTPMKKGMLGVGEMNLLLQRFLNPPEDGKKEKEFGDKLFRVGDKVMQTKNDYQMHWQIRGYNRILLEEGDGVFNGDVGVIAAIDEQDRSVEVLFDDGKCAFYGFDQVQDLELAYAMTIHKSQGSEYPVVILPLLGVPYQMIYRNLLYTAITRAQQCVLILGSGEAVASMIRSREQKRRYTGLAQRLEEMAYEEK
nr:ATP-binding domain-containing protein [Lachnospiraceae bacterium]